MGRTQLPVTCPICGRKNEFLLEVLVEGATIECVFCKIKLVLHGHMWGDIRTELAKLEMEKSE
jgi:hypothetical protein